MGTGVGEVAQVGEAAGGLGGDGNRLVADAKVKGEIAGDAVVVCNVATKDGLTEIARAYALGQWRVEAGRVVGEKGLQAGEDVLAIRVRGAELIVLQALEGKAHLEGMLAFGEIDVVVELIGVEVENELAGGVEATLEVGDAADVDKADGQAGDESELSVRGCGVDRGERGRGIRDDSAVAEFDGVEEICVEGVRLADGGQADVWRDCR